MGSWSGGWMENVVVGSSQVDGWKIGNVEMHVSVGMRIGFVLELDGMEKKIINAFTRIKTKP